MPIKLSEAKDLTIYKKLLNIFGEYTDLFPATGVDRIFNTLVKKGIKTVPKDKKALGILDSILCRASDSVPGVVSDLLNTRFSELPFKFRPVFLSGRAKEVAFYSKDGKLYDKVINLLSLGDEKVEGWVDVHGKKVTVVDSLEEE
jgi:hypothetical protein